MKKDQPLNFEWWKISIISSVIAGVIGALAFIVISPDTIRAATNWMWNGLNDLYSVVTMQISLPAILWLFPAMWIGVYIVRFLRLMFFEDRTPIEYKTIIFETVKLFYYMDPKTKLPVVLNHSCPHCNGLINKVNTITGSEINVGCQNGHLVVTLPIGFADRPNEIVEEYFYFQQQRFIEQYKLDMLTKIMQKNDSPDSAI